MKVSFIATNTNTGPITINGQTLHLHRNGKPLTAGEVPVGSKIEFDRETGEVVSVKVPNTK